MIVITYHKVIDTKNFNAQIEYISKRFKVLDIFQFTQRVRKHKEFFKDELLITFDDGDYSVLENALPVLSKYNCPAILFIVTELIGTNRPFWWDEIDSHTPNTGKVKLAKTVSNTARLEELKKLRAANSGFTCRQLTIEELKSLEKGGVAIANHSNSHPMLDQCTDEEIRKEFQLSQEFFRRNGMLNYNLFAYPNGNYDERVERIVKEEGIEFAFLFDHKLVKHPYNPLRISRLSVNDDTPLWKFKLILDGWHSRILPLTKRIYKLVS